MLTTLVSEQLVAVDSPLGEASNQNGSLDTDMPSPPILDNQLPADLPTDSPNSMPSTPKASHISSKSKRLIEEL